MTAVTERVAAGAAFLDEHDPEWWRADVERAIDLGSLDLFHGDRCVLGQRCPVSALAAFLDIHVADETEPDELASTDWAYAYDAHLRALTDGQLADKYARLDWAAAHGFIADDGGPEWDNLTAEWKRVITERRAAS